MLTPKHRQLDRVVRDETLSRCFRCGECRHIKRLYPQKGHNEGAAQQQTSQNQVQQSGQQS